MKEISERTLLLLQSLDASCQHFRVRHRAFRLPIKPDGAYTLRLRPRFTRHSVEGLECPAPVRSEELATPSLRTLIAILPKCGVSAVLAGPEDCVVDGITQTAEKPIVLALRQISPSCEIGREPVVGVDNQPRITCGEVVPNALLTRYQPAPVLAFHRVNLAITIETHRIAFHSHREQVGTAGLLPQPRQPRQSLGQVAAPEAPPEMKGASLADRLRWILTPNISQLVSDLAVPERPFPFQLQGIKWLMDRQHALLADEMGLGKTMQAIIAARLLWRQKSVESILIICPKGLLSNWKREISRWWPDAVGHIAEPPTDKRWFLRLATPNVLIKLINYEALAREYEWLRRNNIAHDLVIIDEAQRIKSPSAKTSIAVKCLRGKRCWALTGTPLENRIEDFQSIMDFVCPGSITEFNLAALRKVVQSYVLRRKLDDPDIGVQLPAKIEHDIEIELMPAQREAYDRMELDGVCKLNAEGDTVTVQHVFALIRKLSELCNFEATTGERQLERLQEDLREIASSGKKALVFSQFVSEAHGLKRIGERLRGQAYRVLELHGEVPQGSRQPIIDRFNSSPVEQVLLINYVVGALGLNLQAAGYVFLFDRWWNPAVEDQAVKRAHRIGQKDRVIVSRFYCKNTIEERIIKALNAKRRLFRELIDGDRPHEAMGFTAEELFSLFNLKVRPRRAETSGGSRQIRWQEVQPYEFEALLADLYRAQGFSVDHCGGRGDGGIDVLAERKNASGVERIAVQCKHVSAPVGPEILRSLWGTIHNDNSLTAGVLATTSVFTHDAETFARDKRLRLLDRNELKLLLHQFNVALVAD